MLKQAEAYAYSQTNFKQADVEESHAVYKKDPEVSCLCYRYVNDCLWFDRVYCENQDECYMLAGELLSHAGMHHVFSGQEGFQKD